MHNIQDYLKLKKIFPIEQKENKKKSRGTRDQLLIDKMVLDNLKTKQFSHPIFIWYGLIIKKMIHYLIVGSSND